MDARVLAFAIWRCMCTSTSEIRMYGSQHGSTPINAAAAGGALFWSRPPAATLVRRARHRQRKLAIARLASPTRLSGAPRVKQDSILAP